MRFFITAIFVFAIDFLNAQTIQKYEFPTLRGIFPVDCITNNGLSLFSYNTLRLKDPSTKFQPVILGVNSGGITFSRRFENALGPFVAKKVLQSSSVNYLVGGGGNFTDGNKSPPLIVAFDGTGQVVSSKVLKINGLAQNYFKTCDAQLFNCSSGNCSSILIAGIGHDFANGSGNPTIYFILYNLINGQVTISRKIPIPQVSSIQDPVTLGVEGQYPHISFNAIESSTATGIGYYLMIDQNLNLVGSLRVLSSQDGVSSMKHLFFDGKPYFVGHNFSKTKLFICDFLNSSNSPAKFYKSNDFSLVNMQSSNGELGFLIKSFPDVNSQNANNFGVGYVRFQDVTNLISSNVIYNIKANKFNNFGAAYYGNAMISNVFSSDRNDMTTPSTIANQIYIWEAGSSQSCNSVRSFEQVAGALQFEVPQLQNTSSNWYSENASILTSDVSYYDYYICNEPYSSIALQNTRFGSSTEKKSFISEDVQNLEKVEVFSVDGKLLAVLSAKEINKVYDFKGMHIIRYSYRNTSDKKIKKFFVF